MDTATLLVTMSADADLRRAIESALPAGCAATYLDDLDPDERSAALASADALLSWRPHQELDDGEFDRLREGQVVQLISAGVDYVPLERFPDGVVLQNNAGATAEPIAEHVLAFYLALSKRLPIEHRKLQRGEFDQVHPNKRVAGSTCGILGYGAIGQAAARLLKPLGVSILAINRRGEAAESAAFVGTPDDLEYVMRHSGGLVVTAPLTPETRGIIDREKLEWLADDGMVINVARGELIDQRDLYEHLRENESFQAGIDAWWTEPVRHGEFDVEYPLLDLPNVLGSPHNSARVPGMMAKLVGRAVETAGTAVTEGAHENVIDRDLGY